MEENEDIGMDQLIDILGKETATEEKKEEMIEEKKEGEETTDLEGLEEKVMEETEEIEVPQEVEGETEETEKETEAEETEAEVRDEEIERMLTEPEPAPPTPTETEVETAGGTLVVRKYSTPLEAEVLSDMDQAIALAGGDLGTLSSKVLEEYVYSVAGKPVLSLAGIFKVARMKGNIEVKIERIERTPRRCVYKATARDLDKNITVEAVGVVDLDIIKKQVERLKEEAKKGLRSTERDYEAKLERAEEFMEELASSYARRNALRCLIDEREWAYKFSKALIQKKSPT